MPTVNSCCCFSLKSGSTIIGIFKIMEAAFIMLVGVWILTVGIADLERHMESERRQYSDNTRQMTFNTYSYNDDNYFNFNRRSKAEDKWVNAGVNYRMVLNLIGITCVIIGATTMTFGSLLIHGIRNESVFLMKVWIIFRLVVLVVDVAVSVIGLFLNFSILAFIFTSSTIAVSVWFIIVVHSHRQNILNGQTLMGRVYSKPPDQV